MKPIQTWQHRVKLNGTWEGDAMKLEIDDLHQRVQELEADLEKHRELLLHHLSVIDPLRDRVKELEAAVHQVHSAKGRYHTQLATCDLFDLCGLKSERPVKAEIGGYPV